MESQNKEQLMKDLFIHGFYPHSKVVSGDLLKEHGIELIEICRKPFNGGLMYKPGYQSAQQGIKWLGGDKPLAWGANTGWNITTDFKYALCRVDYDEYINYEIKFKDQRNLPILKLVSNHELCTFLDFWSEFYSYPKEELYERAINKKRLVNNDIQDLFVWKNGTRLSTLKQKSLNKKIMKKLDLINQLKRSDEINLDDFFSEFKDVSTVWKVFLLHIIKPEKFPIYDQHIHRASAYILNIDVGDKPLVSISDKAKLDYYLNTYLSFIQSIEFADLKVVDEAFFSFGQFLNSKFTASNDNRFHNRFQ